MYGITGIIKAKDLLEKRSKPLLMNLLFGRQECPACKNFSLVEKDRFFLPNEYMSSQTEDGVPCSKIQIELKCKKCNYPVTLIGNYLHRGENKKTHIYRN